MIRALRRLVPAVDGDWPEYASNMVSLTLGSGAAQFLMAVSTLLTARQLGVVPFGEYASCFSLAGFSAVLFNLGLDNWVLREGSYRDGELGSLVGRALVIKTVLGLVWFSSVVVVAPRLNPSTFSPPLIALSAASVWLEGVLALLGCVFKVRLRNQVTALLMVGARALLFALTGAMIIVGQRRTLSFAYARLAATAAATAGALILLPTKLATHPTQSLRQTMRDAVPFALSDLLTSVYVQADTTLAALLLDGQMVGLYATASRLINALFVIPSACYSVAVPILMRAFRDGRRSIRRAITSNVILFAGLGVALFVLTVSASRLLPAALLGGSFQASGDLLAILSPIILLKSLSFAAVVVLVVVGWQKHRVWPQAISAFVNVSLNLVFIRRFGVTGIAWVYVVSETVLLAGYVALVTRWLRRSAESTTGD